MSNKSFNSPPGIINAPLNKLAERVLYEKQLPDGLVYRQAYIEETFTTTAAASKTMTTSLPANAVISAVLINYETAVTLATAVKVGFGNAGDIDAYGLTSTAVTKNTKQHFRPNVAPIATATPIGVYAAATDGSAAGTLAGTFRVVVMYTYISGNLANAA
jgi:hypothetical protein